MSTSDLVTYPMWDLEQVTMPVRTAFYHLEPIGIGTPFVESLASYVARLAQVHQINFISMTNRAIRPLALTHPGVTLKAIRTGEAYKLNNLCRRTKTAVSTLQLMTGNDNLQSLTMLNWHQVINRNDLLHRSRTWCPACYEQARQSQQVIYDQLVWNLAPVTHCSRHRQPLQSRCPTCQKTLPCVNLDTSIGYCPYCHTWLGQPALLETRLTLAEAPWSNWVTESLAELVAVTPDLINPPTIQRFVEIFTFLANHLTEGNLTALTRRFGLTTIYRFYRCEHIPSIHLLLDICHHLGLSPLQFLTQPLSQIDLSQLKPPASDQLHHYRWSHRWSRSHKPDHLQSTKQALEQIVAADEEPPPTMSMVAKRLGFTKSYLARNFPELWYDIAERYRAYHALRKQKSRLALEAALISPEKPPPSGNRVAKRLGTCRNYLIQHFPQLYAQVNQRYHDYIDAHKVTSRKHTRVMGKPTS